MSVSDSRLARRKKNEQCLLLHYLLEGALPDDEGDGIGIAHFNENCKYTSFIPIKGKPTEMMSALTGRSDLASLLHLTPYQLSFLVPKIRLYKTYLGQPGAEHEDKTWDVELLFADNFPGIIENTALAEHSNPVERMLSDRAGRGTGVGIRGFSWKYEGTNPAEAANLLSANLSIHLNDIRELFEKRGPFSATLNPPEPKEDGTLAEKEDCYFQFADLIMRTASTGEASVPRGVSDADSEAFCKWMWLYDPEYFELKAVVGWEFKDGAPFSPAQRQNLKSASIILYLTIYDHVISYNEDGTMSLDISYKAAIEGILEDRNTDLFLTVFERTRQAQIEAMIEALETGDDQIVSGDGNIRADPQNAYEASADPTARGTQRAGLSKGPANELSDEGLKDALISHLNEMRGLTRGMGYATLQKWLWDETYIPTLNDQHLGETRVVTNRGRKLKEDPVDYSATATGGNAGGHLQDPQTGFTRLVAFSDSAYAGGTPPAGLYGAPWPLSYAYPHGADHGGLTTIPGTGWPGAHLGLSRIKTILVDPMAVGRETENATGAEDVTSITFVEPPWAQQDTGGNDRTLSLDTGMGSSGALAGTGIAPGSIALDDEQAREIGEQMDQAIGEGMSPGLATGNEQQSHISQRAINSTVTRQVLHDLNLGSGNPVGDQDAATKQAVGNNTYPLRYIYYGDLLDWAIRKALWRPPFTPDQFYVALDTFSDMAKQAGAAQDRLYQYFGSLSALDLFYEAPNTPEADSNPVPGQTNNTGGSIMGPSVPQSMGDASQNQQTVTIYDAIKRLDNMKERKFDKLNIVVGSVEYFDPVKGITRDVNLADIPISLARWNEFFINKIQRPGVYSYNLKQFINDTLNDLVLDILGGRGCYASPAQSNFTEQTFDIGITNFTLPAYYNPETEEYENPASFITSPEMYINPDPPDGEEPNYRIDVNKIMNALAGDAMNPDSPKTSLFETSEDNTEVFHFIAIYARGYESSTLLGLETDEEAEAASEPGGWIESQLGEAYADNPTMPGDLSRGIFHFYLGQNQGMIKSIKFTRTDQEYLAEARLMGHGAFGYNQLRGRYEATVIMQGNTFFLPGQYIYINPDSVGSGDFGTDYTDAALLLGLGGYYVVLDIESTITAEFYETTLKCVWHSAGRLDICKASSGNEQNLLAKGARITSEDASSFALSIAPLSGEPGSGPASELPFGDPGTPEAGD